MAVVTGGGSGIGRATALLLADLGSRVIVMGRREEALAETVELGRGRPGALPMTPIAVDIRETEQVDVALDQALAEHGRIDLLVNNAGGQFMAAAETVSLKGFRAVTRLNLDAQWYLTTRVAALSMIPRGYGKVVTITMTPRRGIPGMAHSSAARAAMESLTQTLAAEWAQHGIRLVAVAPGIVHTKAWEGYGIPPETMAAVIPAGRLQTPEDVAAVVAFFLSPGGDYVTGTTIVADGGWDLVGPYQSGKL